MKKTKIESGVPLPEERTQLAELFPIKDLKVGESLTFPLELRNKMQVRASQLKARASIEFTIRAIDKDNARIWRTK